MMATDYKVHAPFPVVVVLGADLDLNPANWKWVHCLTIPHSRLFSHQPYKWILYAIGVVVGAHGVFSSSPDSLTAVEYNDLSSAESVDLYYHINEEEKRRMFPLDPRFARTQLTSTDDTLQGSNFREEVAERDGRRCVLTRKNPVFCDAVHLLSHSKGDMYISNFTKRRSRDPTQADVIEEINSIRNGLFMFNPVHRILGTGLAFLMTPNFAMETTDIDPAALPTEKRCTAHDFVCLDDEPFLGSFQIPDTNNHPPAILFDAVYASAIVQNFGTQAMTNNTVATWSSAYPDEVEILERHTAADQRRQKREEECAARYEARESPDIFDRLMILLYIRMSPEGLRTMFKQVEEKVELAEQRRVAEKVDAWIKQVDADGIV